MIITHHPIAPLAAYIDAIWFTSRDSLPHTRERGLPTGRVDIVIPLLQDSIVRFDGVDSSEARHFRGAVVSGAHDRFVVRGMGGASSVIGVNFKPGGAAIFFGGALRLFGNQTILLDDVWGPAARDLRQRLQAALQPSQKIRILERELLSRLSGARPDDRMVTWAVHALELNPSAARITAVQRASDCSPQQFIRRFAGTVGITPKRYARVLRFNTLLLRLARVGPRDWANVAAEAGYFDQSHLIHEFRQMAGITPASYEPLHIGQPTHVPILSMAHRTSRRKNLQYPGRGGDYHGLDHPVEVRAHDDPTNRNP
jgi:AraC-like DNA-binding protein